MTSASSPTPPRACFLAIGNELLSGRTEDANTPVLARALNTRGLRLEEVRILPDIRARLVESIVTCRAAYDLVFTSGGIGPTHDDITAACVAEAFGVPLVRHEDSFRKLEKLFADGTFHGDFNAARQRMAWLPEGATPIENSVSTAPGFALGNVYVMAGVPRIFRAMLDWLLPRLPSATPLCSQAWHAFDVYEGDFAAPLTRLQQDFPTLDLGSYPFEPDATPRNERGVTLVAKGYDAGAVRKAGAALRDLLGRTGRQVTKGEPGA
ncbi:competence/damage-inducible protein A [Oecophyllibacter saccharovorans]|uniref:competence/damage-inducible protein A n=1 Tax=Oecophyllibacter saccharovorans TaxID=2558360 RepID=UPI001141D43E|nr:competence/damage-inducible protein A [Oecophyllibacter saccharovorans]QDH15650.1 competence/damage-inducible protein A [Oecophyllibacter saccharovorans]